jgi:hypothetical protein
MASIDYRGGVVTVNGAMGALLKYKATTGITAHSGGGQGSAVALVSDRNFVTTSGADHDSVKLPTGALGYDLVVVNASATHSVDIYPTSGGQIDALGTDQPYTLAAASVRRFYGQSATQWFSGA